MVSFTRVAARVKHDLVELLSAAHLARLCRDAGMQWRRRVLDPVVTIQIFILQVLHGNTPCSAVPRIAGLRFTASAWCQARQRLAVPVLRRLLYESGAPLRARSSAAEPAGLWRGHRTLLVDGSSCSMPDTPALRRRFGQPTGQKPGCGFPVAHLLALFDAHSGRLLDVLISSWRTHDLTRAADLQEWMRPGDLLVADRGFCSYAHLAQLRQRGVQVVFRMRAIQIVDFQPHRPAANRKSDKGRPRSTWLARCGFHDQLVLWHRPRMISRNMTIRQHEALPEFTAVRELRYRVRQRGFRTRRVTLATTLLDPEAYPADAIAELYAARWQVETNFRHLKQTLGMAVLRSKTIAGVEKEILVFAIVYNLVRTVMLDAARTRAVDCRRISFLDALRYLRWPLLGDAAPPLLLVPLRPGRVEPRVRKRRPLNYPLMTQPRAKLRNALKTKHNAA